jgi:alpha-glucosidase
LLFLAIVLTANVNAQKYGLTSPDGKLTAGVEIDNGIYVALLKGREALVRMGNIGLETQYLTGSRDAFKVLKVIPRTVNEIVTPEIREKSATFSNSYNELEIKFKGPFSIVFRLFNEGLAYRLITSSRDSLKILHERTSTSSSKPRDSARFQSSETFNFSL